MSETSGDGRRLLAMPYSTVFTEVRVLDMFLPTASPNGAAILFIHGGGWRGGKREAWHAVMTHFSGLGYACASADYHLAPEQTFPQQVEDVRLAMDFVKQHASEYGYAADRVAVWGSSAGGHLAAMLATLRTEDKLGMTEEVVDQDTRPCAAVCLCTVTDLHWAARPEAGTGMVEAFLGITEEEAPELYRQASPVDRVRGGEPPFLLVVGDADRTTPLANHTAMHDRLEAHHVPSELIVLPGVAHGFGYGVTTDAQKQTLAHAEAFLARFTRP